MWLEQGLAVVGWELRVRMQVNSSVKGLACPAKESDSGLDMEKREQAQSSAVGGQADKTWQLMGCEEVEKKEEWKNKE